ncbi:Stress responsive alpha-beta barrel domain-containing protein [Solidesulfovibrio carbinoliphilus subsp. oakridgensis]|uniref:Stress responsive alpha-beta barrel domain-containing protein n=1 Tax=Solidesulfovibrio carbinoliphilus subsp. oakridgensis TaxID=694327 RepID=G7Q6H1_9BACT|nr:Dabb family protein [Solidesulfovibrio carbinoliphilus]EHJ47584.1 Stress responsive alpha-beta barrel domain-containing protein [Solidesulfovibrio carbinoliphilus subsp. oakridgensis]
MIRHIVMWTLKEEAGGRDKAANAAEMQARLLALRGKIPLAVELEVAIGDAIFASVPPTDIVLATTFRTKEDLQAYAVHPLHMEVVEFIKSVVAERRVVDFEV